MRIAIIGSGISGLTAAYLLASEHEITVFEANGYVGGHTHTHHVECDDGAWHVDSGFIVFNERTYPNFIKLLTRLGVESQLTSMSFSVRCEKTGLEYCGTSLNSLFAQRGNLLRPSFHRMIRDILRFNREAPEILDDEDQQMTLGEYLDANHYSSEFTNHYILPMGGAIWSAHEESMRRFPVRYFVQFYHNHGLLSVRDRPQWRVIKGGSFRYVESITRSFSGRIRLNAGVSKITRQPDGVQIRLHSGEHLSFDQVILAVHSDQALAMLGDPTPNECDILRALLYQPNRVTLHTDQTMLPRRRRAWASWNCHLLNRPRETIAVTYNMNLLQSIPRKDPFCVTLNRDEDVRQASVIERMVYDHPVYTAGGVEAQKRHHEISGVNRTHYCGAYWGYGFHEDGVKSALAVCRAFGKEL